MAAPDGGSGDKAAKARLVLLGYEDPDLESYRADAPTISRPGKYITLATASMLKWRAFTLDAHTAFLLGDSSTRTEPLYCKPPRRT